MWVIGREQEGVKMMAILALTAPLCSPGSMYDGLADNYNNYGTTSRSSYFSKFQAGNGSWGYPVRHCFRSERSRVSVSTVWGSWCRKLSPVAQREKCRLRPVDEGCRSDHGC